MKVHNHDFVLDIHIMFLILSVCCFSIFPIGAPLSKSLYATVRDTIDQNIPPVKCTAWNFTIIILLLTVPSCFSSCLFVVFQYFPLKLLGAKALRRLSETQSIDLAENFAWASNFIMPSRLYHVFLESFPYPCLRWSEASFLIFGGTLFLTFLYLA